MKLREYKHVHCIGVGGIGLSALARYCHAHGARVTGSDGSSSRITEDLEKEGIVVHSGHIAANVLEGTTLVIYSIAVQYLRMMPFDITSSFDLVSLLAVGIVLYQVWLKLIYLYILAQVDYSWENVFSWNNG